MSAPVLDFFSWPRSRVLPETPVDVRGLALHLADINGENWQTWTPERRAQIENIALTAIAAVKETGRV